MSILDALADAELFLSSRSHAARARGLNEELRLWRYVRESKAFVHETGQAYRFEDFLGGHAPQRTPEVDTTALAGRSPSFQAARELLIEALAEATEPEQKQHVLILIALLDYIAVTHQGDEVEDFFIHCHQQAPLAIAHFSSRVEAEAWLQQSTEPPSPARILIGDEYFQFWYDREDKRRGMYRDFVIEPALAALAEKGTPPGAPSFKTRAEAEEWLEAHPATSATLVVISGEDYFALYHPRLRRHTLHHVATAQQAWEEHKRAVQREEAPGPEPRKTEGGEPSTS